MLRTLHQIGIKPYLVVDNRSMSATFRSRFAAGKIIYNDIADVPNILIENFGYEKHRSIVICCDDMPQSIVDQHYDTLKDKFILANIAETQGAITEMMAKSKQNELAKKYGVLTPESWECIKNSNLPEDIIFPCIAKPIKSIYGGKPEIRVCETREELENAIKSKDYLVQQYIQKDFEVTLWGTSLSDGEYYITGVTRKIRQYPTERDLSSYCVLESFQEHPNLNLQAIMQMMRALKYTGLFNIEMVVKDDKYYLVEINLRNGGKQHFSTVAGANLPLLYISSLLGIPCTLPKPKYPAYFMGELSDIRHVMAGRLKPLIWLRDLFRTKSFFMVNLSDTMAWLPGYLNIAYDFVMRKLKLKL